MPINHGTPPRVPQDPHLPASLARLIETTHAVCEDATLPTWTRHHAIVELAESALLLGRTMQVSADLDALRGAVSR